MSSLGRRSLVKSAVALATVGVPVAVTRAAKANGPVPAPNADSASAPWWLITPFYAGSALGHGWTLRQLEPIRHGAAVLVLEDSLGRAARVHLCRRCDVQRGIAASKKLDFVLMNGADGQQPSDEQLGLVLMSLARRIAWREGDSPAPAELLTHEERLARYGAEAFS